MSKRVTKIKEEAPELLSNPDIYNLAEQADQLHSLKTLADTDGGKDLINLLIKDVVYAVHKLCGKYKIATHTELIATIADMHAHLTTAQLLLRSKDNLEIVDSELDEMLRE
jgi:hypothetical protein